VGGGSQRGFESRAQFIECQPASREVLAQGCGSLVPVVIANAHARGWGLTILSGHLGQVPQHGGVAIQRGPAPAGEGDDGLCSVVAGHFRPHVSGAA
jgi:hypothetical protein